MNQITMNIINTNIITMTNTFITQNSNTQPHKSKVYNLQEETLKIVSNLIQKNKKVDDEIAPFKDDIKKVILYLLLNYSDDLPYIFLVNSFYLWNFYITENSDCAVKLQKPFIKVIPTQTDEFILHRYFTYCKLNHIDVVLLQHVPVTLKFQVLYNPNFTLKEKCELIIKLSKQCENNIFKLNTLKFYNFLSNPEKISMRHILRSLNFSIDSWFNTQTIKEENHD